jgi:ferric-dicitrate binding protein FerR (iron transport regulator)
MVSAYLNGELSAKESETLLRLLGSDPAALTEFVRAMDLHAELRKVFLEGKGSAEALREIRRTKRFRAWRIWGSIAASAAVVAVVCVSWVTPAHPKSVARLEAVAGQVRLIATAGRSEEVGPGREILAGQGLETVGDSRATVKLPDGTSLDLMGRTKVEEFAQGGENRIVLSKGKLAAEVAHQAADRPMIFETVHGDAKVLGTSLKLAVDPDFEKGSTRLEVTQGLVRLTRRHIGDSVEVAAGHYAVVARERAPETRTLTAELVRQMAPNSWLSLPGTHLRQALPDPVKFPKVSGLRDPRGIVNSWSGGVLDPRRNRLVLWGGGHVNYAGNEIYAFDLESLVWERLTDPTPDPAVGSQINADGTPVARATYNGLACIAHADGMFALGGDLAPNGGTPDLLWMFDFATNAWQNRNPLGDRPPTWVGCACAYDPETRKVWWGEGRSPGSLNGGLYSYDFDGNRWTKQAADSFYYQTTTVDTRRGMLVAAGNGKMFAYDIRRGGPPVRQVWRSSGGDPLIAKQNPGFEYDPSADRLVGWAGGSVYSLNPETKVWEIFDAPGSPKPTDYGIFGRWRYVPALNVYVVVTGIDENVHFYKLPARG